MDLIMIRYFNFAATTGAYKINVMNDFIIIKEISDHSVRLSMVFIQ